MTNFVRLFMIIRENRELILLLLVLCLCVLLPLRVGVSCLYEPRNEIPNNVSF